MIITATPATAATTSSGKAWRRRPALAVHESTLSPAAQMDPSMTPPAFMADHHAYLSLMVKLAESDSGFDVIHNHSLHHSPVAMAPMVSTPMLTAVHTPPAPWLESALQATGGAGTRFAAVSRHTAVVKLRCTRRFARCPMSG